jgi:hypothetical protein
MLPQHLERGPLQALDQLLLVVAVEDVLWLGSECFPLSGPSATCAICLFLARNG